MQLNPTPFGIEESDALELNAKNSSQSNESIKGVQTNTIATHPNHRPSLHLCDQDVGLHIIDSWAANNYGFRLLCLFRTLASPLIETSGTIPTTLTFHFAP